MYATVPRVALAVLHTDLTLEPEMRLLLPADVAIYANRVQYPPQVTAESLDLAVERLAACVGALADLRPGVVVWGCTSGSVHAGPAAHERLLADLAAWAPGASAITAASAVLDALAELGAERVAVATPYPPEIAARLAEAIEARGHAVAALTQAFDGPVDDWALQSLMPGQIADLARRADRPDADAVLVSCTGLAGASVVEALERELGKPVVTSNVAIARAVRVALGRTDALTAYGTLLEGSR